MLKGKLKLSVVDVFGDFVTEPVDVILKSLMLSQVVKLRDVDVRKPVVIDGLNPAPNGSYRIEVDAMSYHAVSRFVNVPASGTGGVTITLPVNPKKVRSIVFPAFGDKKIPAEAWTLLNNSNIVTNGGSTAQSGKALYDGLQDIPKAGFLNLVAKANRTRFTGQTDTPRSALSYIQQVTALHGDRFLALVDGQLRQECAIAKTGGLLNLADETLHSPPAGFAKDRSYKTQDLYGNLQLSFFSSPSGQFALDMDIDDAQGFDHIFQVLGNIGGHTHPYNIHQILIASQELDPGYELILKDSPAKKAKAARTGTKLEKRG
jgi:hypothetical protein